MKNGIPNNLNNGIGIDPVSVEPTPQPTPEPAPTANATSTPQPTAAPETPAPTTESANTNVIPDLTAPPVSEAAPTANVNTNAAPQPIPGTEPTTNNPNVANSNGFVEPNKVANIGTQPPQVEKKQKPINKILFIILIVALICGVAYGVYYYLSLGNNIKVSLKNVTSPVNETLSSNVEDYATVKGTDTKNCSVITTEVDNSKVGTYNFTVKCGNNTYNGKIKIVEATEQEPTENDSNITVSLNDVKIKVGESVTENDFIVENSCSEENCEYTFANKTKLDSDIQNPGTYDVMIDVKSDNSKSIAVHANLIVLAEDYKVFAVCSKTDGNVQITDRIAFNSVNEFSATAYRVYKYTFDNDEDYNSAIGNKDTRVTYNDVTGNAKYNSSDKIMSIVVPLDKDILTSEYGSEFPKTYVDITAYYQNNGYTCTIEK